LKNNPEKNNTTIQNSLKDFFNTPHGEINNLLDKHSFAFKQFKTLIDYLRKENVTFYGILFELFKKSKALSGFTSSTLVLE
jgi:hypothetical protein